MQVPPFRQPHTFVVVIEGGSATCREVNDQIMYSMDGGMPFPQINETLLRYLLIKLMLAISGTLYYVGYNNDTHAG